MKLAGFNVFPQTESALNLIVPVIHNEPTCWRYPHVEQLIKGLAVAWQLQTGSCGVYWLNLVGDIVSIRSGWLGPPEAALQSIEGCIADACDVSRGGLTAFWCRRNFPYSHLELYFNYTFKAMNDDVKGSNLRKDPEQWTTGDEPMTDAQRSYLETLAQEAGEDVDENMTKAEASEKIEDLQKKSGRGQGS